jgi:sporulation protein YlmC with PRC-barrel domain
MEGKIKQTDPERRYRRVLSASTLAGDSVKNAAGEDLGKVDELMIDIPSGRVAYAVLSFGGFLRMGNKLFAVPWGALTVDEDRKCFILDVDKAKLENAPGFDKDNWPDMADTAWGSQIHSYYGRKPYWETETLEEQPGRRRSRSAGDL